MNIGPKDNTQTEKKLKPTFHQHYEWKYHLHPVFKLILLVTLNIFAFWEEFKQFRGFLILIEILLAIGVKLKFQDLKGIIKFFLLNFVMLYLLFYLVDLNWWNALLTFGDYALTVIIMFLGAFIFTKATPPKELIIGLNKIGIPKSFALAITIAISFLPIVSKQTQQILMMQKARGYKLSIFHIGPVLIPAILNIMDLSINLSISLESRGFEI